MTKVKLFKLPLWAGESLKYAAGILLSSAGLFALLFLGWLGGFA